MDLGRLGRWGLARLARVHGGAGVSQGFGARWGPMPIAIDLGTTSLRLLQIDRGDPPSLVAAAAIDTPDELLRHSADRLAFQLESLPRLVREGGFRGRRAVCAIPAAHTHCKHIQVARGEAEALPAVVRSALAEQLGCPESALVFRHLVVEPTGRSGKIEAIGMAVARELVERLMQGIRAARLQPVGLYSEFEACLRAFDSITRRRSDARMTTLYVDLGGATTKLVIAHGRTAAFVRRIDWGSQHLVAAGAAHRELAAVGSGTRAATGSVRRDARGAEGTTSAATSAPGGRVGTQHEGAGGSAASARDGNGDRRHGAPPPGLTPAVEQADLGDAPEALPPSLEILVDELAMCLRYHESVFPDRPIDRAIFLGGGARQVGVCQHIARALRLPAQLADPFARLHRTGREPTLGVDVTTPQPGWTLTFGLCLSPTDL